MHSILFEFRSSVFQTLLHGPAGINIAKTANYSVDCYSANALEGRAMVTLPSKVLSRRYLPPNALALVTDVENVGDDSDVLPCALGCLCPPRS